MSRNKAVVCKRGRREAVVEKGADWMFVRKGGRIVVEVSGRAKVYDSDGRVTGFMWETDARSAIDVAHKSDLEIIVHY